jgi:putative nucleotidyltransferase with HDIG domain
MFVEDLECAWEENPIGERRFLLERGEQVELLKRSKVRAVIINTALGADISEAASIASRKYEAAAPLDQRRLLATNILANVQSTTADLFEDVRSGGGISMAQAAPVVREISRAMEKDPVVFFSVSRLKSKDETTFRHSIAVSALLVQFARYMKFDAETVLAFGTAGLVHDIGKMQIPDEILQKQGGLTEAEFETIRSHPAIGHAILAEQGDMPQLVLDICLYHHERVDGKGYPAGLSGDAIGMHVLMATICDVYEAITSARPYKKPWSRADAVAWMLERQGHFDRALLREFVACLDLMGKQALLPQAG